MSKQKTTSITNITDDGAQDGTIATLWVAACMCGKYWPLSKNTSVDCFCGATITRRDGDDCFATVPEDYDETSMPNQTLGYYVNKILCMPNGDKYAVAEDGALVLMKEEDW